MKDGDLIEIGCLAGGTSVLLAQVAHRFGRKLVCVDNWAAGKPWNFDKYEKQFRKTLEPFADCVEVIKGTRTPLASSGTTPEGNTALRSPTTDIPTKITYPIFACCCRSRPG